MPHLLYNAPLEIFQPQRLSQFLHFYRFFAEISDFFSCFSQDGQARCYMVAGARHARTILAFAGGFV